ncbi:hypothetical protein AAE02nite_48440 [Adhaeribacter aerolatus]|uniref:Uncharacterized protein n=1 Tax=Adhaeribacter aerolatus TaxID=670289 RepID=A0A512B5F0_9BACT|nr:hypothetical protein [Adhaeribacter aerolatus]GEO07180.1 hypothetical protein AAE02nite_48440 [Adhaeribacter aerolatus]
MKNIIILLYSFMALMVISSCEEPEVNPEKPAGEEPVTESWSGTIPADLKSGVWFWGSSGPLSYYDPNGNEVGKELEAGRQYKFFVENGQDYMEFQQYLGMRNSSNCVTEIYTIQRGKIKFEGSKKFTFYPEKGSFRTVKTSKSAACPQEDKTRPATANELKPRISYYQMKEDGGAKLLYEYEATDENLQNPLFVLQHVNL